MLWPGRSSALPSDVSSAGWGRHPLKLRHGAAKTDASRGADRCTQAGYGVEAL